MPRREGFIPQLSQEDFPPAKVKKVLQGLANKGLVSDHGKSRRVVSLTLAGLAYLRKELRANS